MHIAIPIDFKVRLSLKVSDHGFLHRAQAAPQPIAYAPQDAPPSVTQFLMHSVCMGPGNQAKMKVQDPTTPRPQLVKEVKQSFLQLDAEQSVKHPQKF